MVQPQPCHKKKSSYKYHTNILVEYVHINEDTFRGGRIHSRIQCLQIEPSKTLEFTRSSGSKYLLGYLSGCSFLNCSDSVYDNCHHCVLASPYSTLGCAQVHPLFFHLTIFERSLWSLHQHWGLSHPMLQTSVMHHLWLAVNPEISPTCQKTIPIRICWPNKRWTAVHLSNHSVLAQIEPVEVV